MKWYPEKSFMKIVLKNKGFRSLLHDGLSGL